MADDLRTFERIQSGGLLVFRFNPFGTRCASAKVCSWVALAVPIRYSANICHLSLLSDTEMTSDAYSSLTFLLPQSWAHLWLQTTLTNLRFLSNFFPSMKRSLLVYQMASTVKQSKLKCQNKTQTQGGTFSWGSHKAQSELEGIRKWKREPNTIDASASIKTYPTKFNVAARNQLVTTSRAVSRRRAAQVQTWLTRSETTGPWGSQDPAQLKS